MKRSTRTQIGIGLLATAVLVLIGGILFHPWVVQWLVNFAPEGVERDWETTSETVLTVFAISLSGLVVSGIAALMSRDL